MHLVVIFCFDDFLLYHLKVVIDTYLIFQAPVSFQCLLVVLSFGKKQFL